ncbi:developmentally regulated gtp-binding protein-related [Holotrichia oblita]|nr:developmentally regulated gtp-binding protein-related [Holotrichia oblita]
MPDINSENLPKSSKKSQENHSKLYKTYYKSFLRNLNKNLSEYKRIECCCVIRHTHGENNNMFIDKVKIYIKAGNGGNGCTSFYTEKYVPNGGPDGGDGGDGGGIIFRADKSKASLMDFRYSQRYHAEDGERGNPKTCHGKGAKDLVIKVPPGTVVKDAETGGIIADLFTNGDEILVLPGGMGGTEGRDPYEDYKKINKELKLYSPTLAKLPQIIALNKADILMDDDIAVAIREFKKHIRGRKVIRLSALTGENLDVLIKEIAQALDALPPIAPMEFTPFIYQPKDKNDYEIINLEEGFFEVVGGFVEELARNVVLGDYDSFNYFQRQLKDRGIIKALKKAGAADGDTIRILDFEFDFVL